MRGEIAEILSKCRAYNLRVQTQAWSPDSYHRKTAPSLGRSRPATKESSVDLPSPEVPNTATVSPARR